MLLLELPAEILFEIFDCVGSSYFRSDSSRLTVCKQWNQFARTTCFQDVQVTQATLRLLMSSPNVDSRLALVKDNVQILDLNLQGFDDWDSFPFPRHTSLNEAARIWSGDHVRTMLAAWTTELNDNLLYLANVVKQSPKVRFLRIQAISEIHPSFPLLQRRDYLFQSTVRAFLSARNLSSLDLDLCGTELVPDQSQEQLKGIHLCTRIGALLTTLRSLRLRIRHICTAVLKPQQHSTKLHLNKVLINLSLFNESPLTTSAGHAFCCNRHPRRLLRLKEDMEKQAKLLVEQMANPRMVRIVTHDFPNYDLRAFDVLTGKNFRLSEGAEWDDDGEIITEEMWGEKYEFSEHSSEDDE